MKFRTANVGTRTTNLAGGDAYSVNEKFELASILLTSFVEDKFYRSGKGEIQRIRELVSKDPKFAAKAAIYARNEFGMRSVSHVVAAELPRCAQGEQWTKDAICAVMRRPDDMLETLACYISTYGKRPIPNSLKKGLRLAIGKFDAYQLAKYRGAKADLSLADLFNLVHPVPSAGSEAVYKSLIEGDLRSTETWETKLTQAGQKAESAEEKALLKAKAWADSVDRMGYFALLRNLRNVLTQGDKETVDKFIVRLVNAEHIRKSLVLPFRYVSALEAVAAIEPGACDPLWKSRVEEALHTAMDIAVDNALMFEGPTCVILDTSGSMGRVEHPKSPAAIGALFAAVLLKRNPESELITFSNDAQYQTVNRRDSVLSIMKSIRFNYGGTNLQSAFARMARGYARLILLSDMQVWLPDQYRWGTSDPKPSFQQYRKQYGVDPKVYSFDLQGYGTLQFPERNVFLLTGFSEKVFDIMKVLEEDPNALVTTIEAYTDL